MNVYLLSVLIFIKFAATEDADEELGKKTADLKKQALKLMELRGVNVSAADTSSIKNVPLWDDIQMSEDLYQNIKSSFDEEQKLLESESEADRTTAPDFKLIPFAKWPMPIKFVLKDVQSADLKPKIRNGLNEIQSKSGCIKFEEVNSKPSGSHINFKEVATLGPGVCANSPLGRQERVNNVNIATTCQVYGTIIHEVLHSLGFAHSQQRPDADEFIQVNWQNMVDDSDLRSNFKPWQYALKGQGPFDYGSIMMYPPTAFSKNGQETLTPKRDPEKNRKLMGRRDHLSNEDVNILKKIYCGSDGGSGKSETCGKQEGKDIFEHDLYEVSGKPESACCELCSAESRCKAYAWGGQGGGTCYLKSADGPVIPKVGISVGIPGGGSSTGGVVGGGKGCGKQDGKDILEHDLYYVNGKPESACCDVCAAESKCKAYAWADHNGGTCYLKSADGPVIPKNGIKLGILGGGVGKTVTCSNRERSCDWWKGKGYCKQASVFYEYVSKRCPKACGKC